MIFKKLKSIRLSKIQLAGLLLAIVGAYLQLPRYFDAYFTPLPVIPADSQWLSLDSSWLLTLNYVSEKNMTWGTDFAFTYGPMGFLSTRVGWGVHGIWFVLYDLFVFANFFLLFYLSFKNSRNKILSTLLIVASILLIPVLIGPSNAHILLAFLVFWIRKSLDRSKHIYYLMQVGLLTILFFMKFNTGLVAFPLFFAGIIYNLINDRSKKWLLLCYALLPFIVIYTLCTLLNVAIVSYVSTAMEVITGYNDLMYLEHNRDTRLSALFIVFATAGILLHRLYIARKTAFLKHMTIIFIYGSCIFVMYKSGFVRGLETDFFIFSMLFILAIPELHFEHFKKYSGYIVIACVAISVHQVYFVKQMPFELKEKFDKFYFSGLKAYTPGGSMHIIPNDNQLPASVKQKIGKNTVDVYPWNSQMLFENELNFLPRPVFQSYTAFTAKLEEMNFAHYNSGKAPQFVIYDYTTIDYRYPLFDESKVNLAIMKNYHPAEFFDFQGRKVILFEKNADFKPLQLIQQDEYAMLQNSPVTLKPGIFYKIGIYNSLKGKIKSVIDHAPELKLDINYDDGTYVEYHIGKELLNSGIFLDRYVQTTEDFHKLFNNDSLKTLRQIKSYNFKALDPASFKDKMRITEYKIVQ